MQDLEKEEKPCCNEHMIPVILIMTSNCAEEMYDMIGYTRLLENYKQTLSGFVGPTEVLACGNTLQVNDYSKFDWTMFDPEDKKKHREETFEDYKKKAYEMGKNHLM